MNDGFTWWMIVLGIAIGVGLVWVFVVRLPRTESDVDASELPFEADWISRNIEAYGGVAPQPQVEEVLELHRQYLTTGPAPLPATWRPELGDSGSHFDPDPEHASGPVAPPLPEPPAEPGP